MWGDNDHDETIGTLYRHGDVLIQQINDLPGGLYKRDDAILAHGEVTGHSHRIREPKSVRLWQRGGDLFLEVKGVSATLVHEEHRAIDLPRGIYRVWKQREYRPDAFVEVED